MSRIKYYVVKLFISTACILFATNMFAQHTILNGDTLTLNKEAKFWLNEELIFGSGTMPDRSYTYIYEAPNSLQKLVNNHKRKLLSPGYKGFKSKIVKFEKEIGHNKKGYDYTILVLEMPNGTKYWCDVNNAYTNHEIVLKTSENNGAQVTNSEPAKDDANNLNNKKTDPQKATSKKKPSKSKATPIF
jgi:hypothetical protein